MPENTSQNLAESECPLAPHCTRANARNRQRENSAVNKDSAKALKPVKAKPVVETTPNPFKPTLPLLSNR